MGILTTITARVDIGYLLKQRDALLEFINEYEGATPEEMRQLLTDEDSRLGKIHGLVGLLDHILDQHSNKP
tara:strand:- start:296 stop:508 length:213 start_codon:yes stop_codon:yes gene_type:complete